MKLLHRVSFSSIRISPLEFSKLFILKKNKKQNKQNSLMWRFLSTLFFLNIKSSPHQVHFFYY